LYQIIVYSITNIVTHFYLNYCFYTDDVPISDWTSLSTDKENDNTLTFADYDTLPVSNNEKKKASRKKQKSSAVAVTSIRSKVDTETANTADVLVAMGKSYTKRYKPSRLIRDKKTKQVQLAQFSDEDNDEDNDANDKPDPNYNSDDVSS
jgi:uncharacterized membrane-anchored protein YhcB (DUF1043 family)